MKTIISIIMVLMMTTWSYANDIYVTQSGNALDLNIVQDGENNTIGSSSTASASAGVTTVLNIDQVGDSNVITYQIAGATYTGVINLAGNSNNVDLNCDSGGSNSSCGTANAVINFTGSSNDIDLDIGQSASATTADVDLVGQSGSDSNTVAATVDGNSAILRITVNGDTNNYLIDIDGNGDSVGHTLIHSHTGGIADVDIVQSGTNDNMITLTTNGNNADIVINQTD
jgi:hypothetical protein|tara:strand:- start:6917 stop:7600 length:684 start_codon:yes stop_codon:yes gene_type:complete